MEPGKTESEPTPRTSFLSRAFTAFRVAAASPATPGSPCVIAETPVQTSSSRPIQIPDSPDMFGLSEVLNQMNLSGDDLQEEGNLSPSSNPDEFSDVLQTPASKLLKFSPPPLPLPPITEVDEEDCSFKLNNSHVSGEPVHVDKIRELVNNDVSNIAMDDSVIILNNTFEDSVIILEEDTDVQISIPKKHSHLLTTTEYKPKVREETHQNSSKMETVDTRKTTEEGPIRIELGHKEVEKILQDAIDGQCDEKPITFKEDSSKRVIKIEADKAPRNQNEPLRRHVEGKQQLCGTISTQGEASVAIETLNIQRSDSNAIHEVAKGSEQESMVKNPSVALKKPPSRKEKVTTSLEKNTTNIGASSSTKKVSKSSHSKAEESGLAAKKPSSRKRNTEKNTTNIGKTSSSTNTVSKTSNSTSEKLKKVAQTHPTEKISKIEKESTSKSDIVIEDATPEVNRALKTKSNADDRLKGKVKKAAEATTSSKNAILEKVEPTETENPISEVGPKTVIPEDTVENVQMTSGALYNSNTTIEQEISRKHSKSIEEEITEEEVMEIVEVNTLTQDDMFTSIIEEAGISIDEKTDIGDESFCENNIGIKISAPEEFDELMNEKLGENHLSTSNEEERTTSIREESPIQKKDGLRISEDLEKLPVLVSSEGNPTSVDDKSFNTNEHSNKAEDITLPNEESIEIIKVTSQVGSYVPDEISKVEKAEKDKISSTKEVDNLANPRDTVGASSDVDATTTTVEKCVISSESDEAENATIIESVEIVKVTSQDGSNAEEAQMGERDTTTSTKEVDNLANPRDTVGASPDVDATTTTVEEGVISLGTITTNIAEVGNTDETSESGEAENSTFIECVETSHCDLNMPTSKTVEISSNKDGVKNLTLEISPTGKTEGPFEAASHTFDGVSSSIINEIEARKRMVTQYLGPCLSYREETTSFSKYGAIKKDTPYKTKKGVEPDFREEVIFYPNQMECTTPVKTAATELKIKAENYFKEALEKNTKIENAESQFNKLSQNCAAENLQAYDNSRASNTERINTDLDLKSKKEDLERAEGDLETLNRAKSVNVEEEKLLGKNNDNEKKLVPATDSQKDDQHEENPNFQVEIAEGIQETEVSTSELSNLNQTVSDHEAHEKQMEGKLHDTTKNYDDEHEVKEALSEVDETVNGTQKHSLESLENVENKDKDIVDDTKKPTDLCDNQNIMKKTELDGEEVTSSVGEVNNDEKGSSSKEKDSKEQQEQNDPPEGSKEENNLHTGLSPTNKSPIAQNAQTLVEREERLSSPNREIPSADSKKAHLQKGEDIEEQQLEPIQLEKEESPNVSVSMQEKQITESRSILEHNETHPESSSSSMKEDVKEVEVKKCELAPSQLERSETKNITLPFSSEEPQEARRVPISEKTGINTEQGPSSEREVSNEYQHVPKSDQLSVQIEKYPAQDLSPKGKDMKQALRIAPDEELEPSESADISLSKSHKEKQVDNVELILVQGENFPGQVSASKEEDPQEKPKSEQDSSTKEESNQVHQGSSQNLGDGSAEEVPISVQYSSPKEEDPQVHKNYSQSEGDANTEEVPKNDKSESIPLPYFPIQDRETKRKLENGFPTTTKKLKVEDKNNQTIANEKELINQDEILNASIESDGCDENLQAEIKNDSKSENIVSQVLTVSSNFDWCNDPSSSSKGLKSEESLLDDKSAHKIIISQHDKKDQGPNVNTDKLEEIEADVKKITEEKEEGLLDTKEIDKNKEEKDKENRNELIYKSALRLRRSISPSPNFCSLIEVCGQYVENIVQESIKSAKEMNDEKSLNIKSIVSEAYSKLERAGVFEEKEKEMKDGVYCTCPIGKKEIEDYCINSVDRNFESVLTPLPDPPSIWKESPTENTLFSYNNRPLTHDEYLRENLVRKLTMLIKEKQDIEQDKASDESVNITFTNEEGITDFNSEQNDIEPHLILDGSDSIGNLEAQLHSSTDEESGDEIKQDLAQKVRRVSEIFSSASTALMRDEDFDFLDVDLPVGGSELNKRSSLYMTFDPLCKPQSNSTDEVFGESFIDCTPNFEHVPKLTFAAPQIIRENTINEENLQEEIEKVRAALLDVESANEIKCRKLQEKIAEVNVQVQIEMSKLEDFHERESSLLKLVEAEEALQKKVNKKISELANQIIDASKELESIQKEGDQIKELEKEKDEALNELLRVESAFTQLHSHYEKVKKIIDPYQTNIDTLHGHISDLKELVRTYEAKITEMDKKYKEKLALTEEVIQATKASSEQELARINGQLRKIQTKQQYLESTIEQKVKENKELDSIINDLTGNCNRPT